MAASAATVVDLAAYRRQREQSVATPAVALQMPVVYVTWWTYVPVYMVPGYA